MTTRRPATPLKLARLRAGIDAADAALAIGKSVHTVYGHERGDRAPTGDILTKYAELYDTTVDELLGITSEAA